MVVPIVFERVPFKLSYLIKIQTVYRNLPDFVLNAYRERNSNVSKFDSYVFANSYFRSDFSTFVRIVGHLRLKTNVNVPHLPMHHFQI
jgi:hypothetical protein